MAGNYDAAMDKLRDEMAENHKDPNLCALGEYMTGLLQERPDVAEKILSGGKSLKGAWTELVAYARKQPRHGNCVAIPDAEAYRVCREYYGISADMPAEKKIEAVPEAAPSVDALDELMGW